MGPRLHSARRISTRLSVLSRRAAAAVLLITLASSTIDVHGQEFPAGRYDLVFASKPASVRVSPDGREVLVEFAGALADGEAERAARTLGGLLEGYAEGYGAVRFRLTTPSRALMALATDARIVEVVPGAEPEASPADRQRLALLEARQQASDGDLAGARVRLQQAVADRPGEIEPLLVLADTENGAGRWRHALGVYDSARRLFPEASDVARDRDALSLRHAPSIRLDSGATFGPNGERSQNATFAGEFPIAERWRVSASVQTTHDEVRGLRRSGSGTTADYSGTKVLAGLGVLHEWDRSIGATRVNFFAAPETVGASVKHELTTRFGETTLSGFYHQPYWSTLMSFAANARRDQVGLAQTIPLPDQWEVQLGAGLVRYGLPAHDNVASGESVLAAFSKGLPTRWLPWEGSQLRLGYRLEGEYLSGVGTGPTSAGLLPLLDVRSREIHNFYAESTLPIDPGVATALVGYAIDRYGGGGPQAMLRYTHGEASDRFAFAVEAGVEPSLDIRPRTLFHIGGFAIMRFGGS